MVTFNLKRNINMTTVIRLTPEEVKAAVDQYLTEQGVEPHGEMTVYVFPDGAVEVSFQ